MDAIKPIVFKEKEIDIALENTKLIETYLREAERIQMKTQLVNQASQSLQNLNLNDEEEAEGIDHQEEMMQLYYTNIAGGANEDKRVQEILKKMQVAANEDLEDADEGETRNLEEDDAESRAIEDLVKNRKD